ELEFPLLDCFICELLQLVFKDCHSLFHPFDPWLKLPPFNQAFGIAINQTGQAALEFVHLGSQTFWSLPLRSPWTGVTTPVIFLLQPLGLVEQLTHFVPYRKLYQIRPHLRIGTQAVAAKPIAIGSHTAIIRIAAWTMFARTGTERSSIIRIATHFAHE